MVQFPSIYIIILLSCIQNTCSFQLQYKYKRHEHQQKKNSLFATKISKPSIPIASTTQDENYALNKKYDNDDDNDNDNDDDNYNWDFLDAVYLITCDKEEANNKDENVDDELSRLNGVKEILNNINLLDKVQIINFETDDTDRVRGCYTSHIEIINKAKNDIIDNQKSSNDDNKSLSWKNILPSLEALFTDTNGNGNDNSNTRKEEVDEKENKQKYVLILEDNLSISIKNFTPKLLSSISSFLKNENTNDINIVHLSYTPFIPNFYIQKSEEKNIIQLNCGEQSALGTTAYILSTNGINTLLENDTSNNGYYGLAIPDVMTEIFTSKRYAVYPIPFIRNFDVKSLVNPQLDTLRTLLFIPSIYTIFENILVFTGLSTNVLLPLFIAFIGFVSVYSIGYSIDNIQLLLMNNGFENTDLSFGNIMLSILSGFISIFSLGIIAFGIALAPKPSNDQ